MFGGFAACRVHLHARRPEASPDLACFGVWEVWKVCCKAGTSKYRTWRRAASVEGACFGGLEGLKGAATRVVEHLSNIEHRSNICRKSIEALSESFACHLLLVLIALPQRFWLKVLHPLSAIIIIFHPVLYH